MNAQLLLLILLFLLLLAVFSLSILTFQKTRKIHLATYPLLSDLSATRKEVEALFGQIHALLALERRLALSQPLPPMRGWAGSPDFLLVIANEVLARKPKLIVECSSGVSTIVIARCLELNGGGHVYSLEHDAHYAEVSRSLVNQYNLNDWVTILHAPLETRSNETPWYSEDALPPSVNDIDIVVVDGPPQATAPHARQPALPRLKNRMKPNAILIIDDAGREGEREALANWLSATPGATVSHPPCEKGCAIFHMQSI